VRIIRTEVGPTSTAKIFEEVVIRLFVVENFKWTFILSNGKMADN
jgi:hypothetical protein